MECKITIIGWLAFLVCLVQHGSLVEAQDCIEPCGDRCTQCGQAALLNEACFEEFNTSCVECPIPNCACTDCLRECRAYRKCCIPYYTNCFTNDGCGNGTYTDPTGTILSPNYPANYLTENICEYVIEQPVNFRIVLTFNDFELEDHPSCIHDHIEVRNGGTARSPLIGKYCGSMSSSTAPPAMIESTGNKVYLLAYADIDTNKGFNISYAVLELDCSFEMIAPPRYCPGTYAEKMKSVTSLSDCTTMCKERPQCQSVIYVPKGGDDRCLLNTCHEDELRAKSDSPGIRCLVKKGAQMWQPQC